MPQTPNSTERVIKIYFIISNKLLSYVNFMLSLCCLPTIYLSAASLNTIQKMAAASNI